MPQTWGSWAGQAGFAGEAPRRALARSEQEAQGAGGGRPGLDVTGGKWWKGPDLGSGLKAECGLMVGTWGRRASSTPKAHGLDSTEGERKSTGGLGWRFKRPL